jgi:hypothetical protein
MRNISRRTRDKTKIGCPARALDHRLTSDLRLPDPKVTRKLSAQLPGQNRQDQNCGGRFIDWNHFKVAKTGRKGPQKELVRL